MAKERASWKRDGGIGGREASGQVVAEEDEEEVEETASHHWVACTETKKKKKTTCIHPLKRCETINVIMTSCV